MGELTFAALKIQLVKNYEVSGLEVGIGTDMADMPQRYVRWDASTAAAAAELEAHQHAAGFQPLLTAAQLRQLGTLLAMQYLENCGNCMARAQAAGERYTLRPHQPWVAALAASRRLLQLLPNSAAALWRHALLLQECGAPAAEELEASEAALQQAEAERSYSLVAGIATNTVAYRLRSPGRTWQPADVEPLLAAAARALKRWRRWGSRLEVDSIAAKLAEQQQIVQHALGGAGSSRAAQPPVSRLQSSAEPTLECAFCGMQKMFLKRCAACRGPAYCSTGCQRSHWRFHRAECRQLVEQREG